MLQVVKDNNTLLQQQLQDAHAALVTSRSHAESAANQVAEAIAQKRRYKADLREMSACVEEMNEHAEMDFAHFQSQNEVLAEELRQERANRVQAMQTLRAQLDSLTADLALSQVRPCICAQTCATFHTCLLSHLLASLFPFRNLCDLCSIKHS